jgi:hypothetical protein
MADTPIVTPPIYAPGMRIDNNLTGGGRRMLFTAGHKVAVIDDEQYDLVSGLSAHNLDVLAAAMLPDAEDGAHRYQSTVEEVVRIFTSSGDYTPDGLLKYTVAPPLA